MDPDAALFTLREAIADWRAAADGGSDDDEHDAARLIVEHFEAIDEWLSRGGFGPREWQPRAALLHEATQR